MILILERRFWNVEAVWENSGFPARYVLPQGARGMTDSPMTAAGARFLDSPLEKGPGGFSSAPGMHVLAEAGDE